LVGFKATLNYETCLDEKNATLDNLYGHTDLELISETVSHSPTSSLPELPECDLEKELDNVSTTTKGGF
jgi:hypothetical protein